MHFDWVKCAVQLSGRQLMKVTFPMLRLKAFTVLKQRLRLAAYIGHIAMQFKENK
jgi:hypothetical protein